ncbi:MAG: glycoside hydrolase family 81 [Planctomycetes bacterium]|nr:glycoside hydrolase family 81 [Planctomycetota bacterium]
MRPQQFALLLPSTLFVIGAALHAAEPIVKEGSGSYTTVLPKGAKAPQATIYATENLKGKMPTNDWWSSVAWMKFSERQYLHPLAVETGTGGLRVFYPGASITANKGGIFGIMPGKSDDDFVLGHAAQAEFPDAQVDAFSDWFVNVRFKSGERSMTVTYGHGSPFVYATYEGGDPRLKFAKIPQIWSGQDNGHVLGITVNGKHYGLFGAAGSKWTGLDGKLFTNQAKGKKYFSVAVLPNNDEKTLKLFQQYAYAHVTGTQVDWAYDAKTCDVTTNFKFTTVTHEGTETGTLFALYPHQWRNAEGLEYRGEYPSVRGKMKLAEGKSFRTVMRFPGVMPALPSIGEANKTTFAEYLKLETSKKIPPVSDTYADGKWLGKLAALIPVAEQFGFAEEAKILREQMRERLEDWLSGTDAAGKPKTTNLFYYDDNWGTLIGYPASYGSDVELNDHHFHYGYFVKAAAEMSRHDPAWAKDERWGRMVKLLIRDMASSDRKDPLFPFLRNFDPYAGHSWASGHARFGDGNNNESSSEAMNAWCGLVLWGEATNDPTIRDLGIYLYTTEMEAINQYWFDVLCENRPKEYTPSVVTMVWGGKGVDATWFSAKPEHIHGINWLPFNGASTYLGRYPAYVEKNYLALVKESGGNNWKEWSDLIWMYLALADAKEAKQLFEASKDKITYEAGNSKAFTYAWIESLNALGQVDRSETADYPLYSVFHKGKTRTYGVYNMDGRERTVLFSDGFQLKAAGKGFVTGQAER